MKSLEDSQLEDSNNANLTSSLDSTNNVKNIDRQEASKLINRLGSLNNRERTTFDQDAFRSIERMGLNLDSEANINVPDNLKYQQYEGSTRSNEFYRDVVERAKVRRLQAANLNHEAIRQMHEVDSLDMHEEYVRQALPKVNIKYGPNPAEVTRMAKTAECENEADNEVDIEGSRKEWVSDCVDKKMKKHAKELIRKIENFEEL